MAGRPLHQLSALPQPSGPGVIDAGGRIGRDFAPERQQEKVCLFGALAAHVAARRKAGDRWWSRATPRARASGWRGCWPTAAWRTRETIAGPRTLARRADGLHLAVWPLEHGFEAPGLTVISEQDVLGDRLIRQTRQAPAGRELPDRGRRADARATWWCTSTTGSGATWGSRCITAMGAPHECLSARICRRRQALPAGREHRAPDPLRARGGAARQAGRRGLAGEEGAAQGADPRHGRAADPHRGRAGAAQGARARRRRTISWEQFLRALPLCRDRRPAPGHRRRARRTWSRAGRWTG